MDRAAQKRVGSESLNHGPTAAGIEADFKQPVARPAVGASLAVPDARTSAEPVRADDRGPQRAASRGRAERSDHQMRQPMVKKNSVPNYRGQPVADRGGPQKKRFLPDASTQSRSQSNETLPRRP